MVERAPGHPEVIKFLRLKNCQRVEDPIEKKKKKEKLQNRQKGNKNRVGIVRRKIPVETNEVIGEFGHGSIR